MLQPKLFALCFGCALLLAVSRTYALMDVLVAVTTVGVILLATYVPTRRVLRIGAQAAQTVACGTGLTTTLCRAPSSTS